jgi:metal-sulfur cluster biosynthetic enzyme
MLAVENDNFAKIKMTLTTPNCPVAESLPNEVKEGAMQVEGYRKCRS